MARAHFFPYYGTSTFFPLLWYQHIFSILSYQCIYSHIMVPSAFFQLMEKIRAQKYECKDTSPQSRAQNHECKIMSTKSRVQNSSTILRGHNSKFYILEISWKLYALKFLGNYMLGNFLLQFQGSGTRGSAEHPGSADLSGMMRSEVSEVIGSV